MNSNDLTKLVETETRSKSNTKRIDEHEKEIDKLKDTYKILENIVYRMGKVENVVDNIDKKISDKSNEKGKKWDKLIDYLFYFILALLLAYIAKHIGLK